MRKLRMIGLVWTLAWVAWTSHCQERTFLLQGVSVQLEDATERVAVFFRSMRLNRALDAWNVEVTLSNRSTQVLYGPLVLLVDGFSGTTGPQQADGTTDDGKSFYDLSGLVQESGLGPGQLTTPRTLTLGRGAQGSPALHTKVYTARRPVRTALGVTRSLDAAGQPLPGVSLAVAGPGGSVVQHSDTPSGVTCFGTGTGRHVLKFSAADHLPVWRIESLGGEQPTVVPNPRLTRRATNIFAVTPLGGVVVSNATGTVRVDFGPGTVNEPATVTLTALTGQNLPAFLPLGWSPLCAFWIESSRPLGQPVRATLTCAEPVSVNDAAALVRWDETALQWLVTQTLSGDNTTTVNVQLSALGAYALVVADTGSLAPPAPQVGAPLPETTVTGVDITGLSAVGNVNPPSSSASRVPELVTALATIELRHKTQHLPSGYVLRGEVTETYLLADGSLRLTPQYEQFIVCYQRPGDKNPSTLHASFPMRPLLLFGPEELESANVRVEVLPPTPFDGQVLDEAGGQVAREGVRLLVGSGRLTGPSAMRLRRLDATVFSHLVTEGHVVLAAFELTLDRSTLTGPLSAQLSGAPAQSFFVLARVMTGAGFYGLQPIERLRSDSEGNLQSMEPLTGDRLPGLSGSGQYVLVQVNAPQGLVSGVARNGAGQAQAGMLVRLSGMPWLTLTDQSGRYQLIAPVGEIGVELTDPLTGDTGLAATGVTDVSVPVNQDVAAVPSGPRVARVSPQDRANRVPRMTSVVICFNEPVNPATVVGNAIELLRPDNSPVLASLSINLKNTVVTLSPATELEADTTYRVRLARTITDLNGLPLEGQAEFSFTTVPLSRRDPAAQLVIYEPGATNVPVEVLARVPAYQAGSDPTAIVVHGTPGVADPGVPVILVNESTGETATVLSQNDGSFVSVISGTPDDFVSATFVNLNGTRSYVPVSRQEFDNGFVGLYRQGGILEAESDGGPVRVIIEPEAIRTKAKLRLRPLNLAQLDQLLGGIRPQDTNFLLATALNLEVEGQPPAEGIKVSVPVNLAALGYPTNLSPTEVAAALTVVRENQGVKAFEVLAPMTFVPGSPTPAPPVHSASARLMAGDSTFTGQKARNTSAARLLSTQGGADAGNAGRLASPQQEQLWSGMLEGALWLSLEGFVAEAATRFVVVPLILGGRPVVIKGKVGSLSELVNAWLGLAEAGTTLLDLMGGTGRLLQANVEETRLAAARPLPGAFIVLHKSTVPMIGPPGRLDPGMVYATSDATGDYLMVAPAYGEYTITATHPSFSDRHALPILGLLDLNLIAGVYYRNFYFSEPLRLASPPAVHVAHSPLWPAPGQECRLQVTASVSQGPAPTIKAWIDSVSPLVAGVPAESDDASMLGTPVEKLLGPGRKSTTYVVTATNAVRVGMRIVVASQLGGAVPTIYYPIDFAGQAPPLATNIPPSITNDTRGPYVTFTAPTDGGFVGPSGQLVIEFNEPINRTVMSNVAGITLWGPGNAGATANTFQPRLTVELSEDQHRLMVRFVGMAPDADYTLALSGQSIQDLSGNPLDQDPRTPEADSFVMHFRTTPVLSTQVPVKNAYGCAISGNRLYTLEMLPTESYLDVYHIDLSEQGAKLVVRVPLLGSPRDLAVISGYNYRISQTGGVCSNELVAVVGGDLASIVDADGTVRVPGQYLSVFEVSGSGAGTSVRQLASAKVSYRVGSAVTKVRWSPPYLLYQEFGADVHLIGFVNLQEMLIGFNASRAETATFPETGRPGVDSNNDGDYVDEGDILPLPQSRPTEFYGKAFNTVLAGTTQKVLDFDYHGRLCITLSAGFERDPKGNVTSVPVRPAYRTMPLPGEAFDANAATVKFAPGTNPRRVFSTVGLVRVGQEIESLHLALVSLAPDADGVQKLAVIDITLPESPRLLNKIPLPGDIIAGQLGSVVRRSDGILELNTSQHILLLDTLAMAQTNTPPGQLHSAIVGFIPAAGATTRSVARTEYGLGAVAEGGRGALIVSAPTLQFVQFPEAAALVNPSQLVGQTRYLNDLFGTLRPVAAIAPARLRTELAAQSDLVPPNPRAHYHVLLNLPGAAGPQLELTLEALNWVGLPLPNKGAGFAPVRACSAATLSALGIERRRSCEPAVTSLKALRLSPDPTNPFFNVYLSEPFALIYESITPAELDQLRQAAPSQILTAGSYLRACIDYVERNNQIIGAYASRIDPDLKEVVPVVAALAQTLEAAYQPGPNPPPAGGPATLSGTFGSVSAHNGEVRMSTVDIDLPSPRLAIEIVRAIGGQDNYDGPFGLGWDFNYNQRVTELRRHLFPQGLEMPLIVRHDSQDSVVARSGDLLFSSGDGRVYVFTHKGTNTPPEFAADPLVQELGWIGRVSDYYLPEAGCFDLMVKFHDGNYERLTPDGTRYRYNQAGQLETIIDAYPSNWHELQYDRGGRLVRITDRSVVADRYVEFGYYRSAKDPHFTSGLDEIAPSKFVEGKICRLRDYAGRDVLFFYDDDGLLIRREGIEVAGENGGFAGRPQTHYIYKDCKIVGVAGGREAVPLFSADTLPNAKGAPVVQSATGISGPVRVNVPLNNSPATLAGQTSAAVLPNGAVTENTLDKYGYPASLKVSSGQESTEAVVTHNEHGQLLSLVHPEGRVETYTYDTNNPVFRSRGNLLALRVDPGPRGGVGYTRTFSYDPRYNRYSGDHTDPNGFIHTYTLTPDGRAIAKIRHGDAGEEAFVYDDHGQLVRHRDQDGIERSHTYDPTTGFLLSVSQGPHMFKFSYGSDVPGRLGKPSYIIPPRGAPNYLKYDNQLNTVEISRGGLVTRYAYDEQGRHIYRLEELGDGRKRQTHLTIDKKGFVTSQRIDGIEVDGIERPLEYVYEPDAMSRVKSILHPGNVLQTMEYNYRGDLTKLVWGDYVQEHTHDKDGNILEVKQGGELLLKTEYDGMGRPKTVIEFTGDAEYRTEYTYYPGGEKRSEITTDSRYGVVSSVEYTEIDALGRVRQMVVNGTTVNPTYRYVYEPGARTIIGPRQAVSTLWDDAGYPSGDKDAVSTLTYHSDGNGNIEQVDRQEDGAIYTDRFEFDDLDHRTAAWDSLGELCRFTPRADGTWREVINPRGNRTTLEHSALGELLLQRREDGMEMRFRHNEHRQLTYAGDPTAGFSYQYDSLFRLVQHTLRDGSSFSYSKFDPRDLPQQIETPGGLIEQQNDRQRRLRTERVTHQGTTYEWSADYDARDQTRRLTWRQDGGQENSGSFSYDVAGPLLSARYLEDGMDVTVGYAYYNDLSRQSISYPSGVVVTEERDGSGRLIGLRDASGVIWRVQSWQGNVQPKVVEIGSNILATHEYDARGRLTASRYTRRDNGAVLAHLRYKYDPAGNVEIRQFVHRGFKLESFVYDKGERVSQSSFGVLLLPDGRFTPPEYERSYSYEPTGLDYLVSVATSGPLAATAPTFASSWAAHNAFLAPMRIDGFSYQTDPVGNLKRVQLHPRPTGGHQVGAIGATLSHNGLGELVRIDRDDGVVIENRFQPTGLRHGKWIRGNGHDSKHSYVYDEGARLLEEYETVNSTTRLIGRFYYASSDAPVAADLLVGGDELHRFYYVKDVTESVVAVVDEAGRVVERISYDTFGQPAIEAADTAAPRIKRILAGQNAELLIELSEPVLPAVPDPGPGTGIVPIDLETSAVAHAITVAVGTLPVNVPGTNQLLIAVPGFAPRSVIRFVPGQMLIGQVHVTLTAGALADDWGNSSPVQDIVFTNTDLALPPGTVLFDEATNTAAASVGRSVVGSPFLFHGQYFDYETGLLYLRARFYDPFSGMFLEPDPLGYQDSVNHYAAFANNPVSRRDPSGLGSNALVLLARIKVLERNPALRNTIMTMHIDDLVRAGGYTSPHGLFADVFRDLEKNQNAFKAELESAITRGDITPIKGQFTPYSDKTRWARRKVENVRAELAQKGFVKVKDSRTITVNGMAKIDGNGGSEIWMRVHVRPNGELTGAECVRIDELGNPCFNSKLRDLRLRDRQTTKMTNVMAGELPHYHAEFVEDPKYLHEYSDTGLKKSSRTGQIGSGSDYDIPTTYDDFGKLLMRRGDSVPKGFYAKSHIRAYRPYTVSAYLTPPAMPLAPPATPLAPQPTQSAGP